MHEYHSHNFNYPFDVENTEKFLPPSCGNTTKMAPTEHAQQLLLSRLFFLFNATKR